MKTKTEIIESIDPTKNYQGSFLIARIKEVDCDNKIPPKYLKKGDVIAISSGVKIRPSVIIKVTKEYVVCIPLTSQSNCVNKMSESKSRFFKDGYFCNTFEVVDIEVAKSQFIGVYDNMKLLNNAIKELRLFIVKNI